MTAERYLAGNGVLLVRERALACAVQEGLCRLYQLGSVESVDAFVEPAEDGDRETLLVREAEDGAIEMSLRLAPFGASEESGQVGAPLDSLCQVIEGVSHFVYLYRRAQDDRTATQLELEVQAEVDKYVVLASATAGRMGRFDATLSSDLRRKLYEEIAYANESDSLLGERYRVANDTAQRFVRRLETEYVSRSAFSRMRDELRRFYWMGQEEKLRAAR